MTGRVLWTDIPVEEIGGRGGTRGCREIVFWAQLFEALRGVRENIACELSAKFNVTWLQRQLMQRRPVLYAFFMNRQHRLLNPATAIQFERRMSFDAKPSERYDRIKSKAAALLKELMGRAA